MGVNTNFRCLAVFAAVSMAIAPSVVFAGEIIVGGSVPKTSSAHDRASDARERAKAQRGDDTEVVPMSTIIEELDADQGAYGSRPGGAASQNMNRARSYQQGGDGSTPNSIDQLLIDPDSNQGRNKNNLDRARAYQRGESPGVTGTRFGASESLPLVDCSQVENVAGRIGDDFASGSVLILMRNGKGVKVRCK